MVRVELRGIAKVTAKGKTYNYAWRCGPRLRGEPGTPQFVQSYNEAIANLRTPDPDRFKSLVTRYKASTDYTKLADTTRRSWSKWLDRIADHSATFASPNLTGPKEYDWLSDSGETNGPISRERQTWPWRFSRASSPTV
jgi:hypothetical protein